MITPVHSTVYSMRTIIESPTDTTDSPRRIPLEGHTPLSHTTIQGWPSIFFGLPFAGFGLFFLLIAIGWTDTPRSSIHAPLWVIGIIGGVFFAVGFWLALHGTRGLHRAWNRNNGQRHLPTKPWLWDYPWNAKGISDSTVQGMIRGIVAMIFMVIFLAPFNWIAFFSDKGDFFWKGIVGLFDIIVILGIGGFISSKFRQYVTYGTSFLTFHTFPFYLGHSLALTLQTLPHSAKKLHLHIRCIEEAYEVRRRKGARGRTKSESVVKCYQLYKASKTFDRTQIPPTGGLQVSWTLPSDDRFTSTPSARPARYWELEVIAEEAAAPYQSFFLLPVYSNNLNN